MSGREREGEKKAKAGAAYMNPDLCEEILHRLPISNDFIKLKLVCKDWLRLISSSRFIKKHLERSKGECNDVQLVVPLRSMTEIVDCTNNKTSKKIGAWEYPYPYILGTCDGLVLYYNYSPRGKIAALNPSTGESVVWIPNQSIKDDLEDYNWLLCTWFGQHPSSSSEYILVVAKIFKEEETADRVGVVFEVYSLARNNIISSSSVELDCNGTLLRGRQLFPRIETIGTLLHGRLHVLAELIESDDTERVILVYDFETKEIVTMAPPQETRDETLGVVDGYLCALDFSMDQVWVMKEYGVKESWTKSADLDERYRHYGITSLRPLAFFPNGDVLILIGVENEFSISNSQALAKYSFKEREIKNLMAITTNDIFTATPFACIHSLVSPTCAFAFQGRQEDRSS